MPIAPLRIAFVGPGASPHIYRLGEALFQRGHSVHIISEDKFAPFPPIQGIQYYTYSSTASIVRKAWSVRAILAGLQPDILHSHAVNHGGFMGVASGFHPHVMNAWGSDILIAPNRSRLHRLETAIALRSADWVLSPARTLQEAMNQIAGILPHNEILQWGVDTAHFSPARPGKPFRDRLGLTDEPVVLSPRTLHPLYNQDVLIEAWPAVLKHVPAARLVISRYLPNAEFEAKLRERADELGITGSMHWVEPTTFDELPSVYCGSDVVVSIPSSDGTPSTVLEALACGRPVVACDLPSLRDWITPGEHGLLAPPKDSARLAAAIIELLTASPEKKRELAQAGQKLVRERADRERCLAQLETIYSTLQARRGAGFLRTVRNLFQL